MDTKKIYTTIPRGNGKRIATIMTAVQRAKEGYTVLITDVGSGQDIIIKPANKATEKIVGRKLSQQEFLEVAIQDLPDIDKWLEQYDRFK